MTGTPFQSERLFSIKDQVEKAGGSMTWSKITLGNTYNLTYSFLWEVSFQEALKKEGYQIEIIPAVVLPNGNLQCEQLIVMSSEFIAKELIRTKMKREFNE